MDKTIHKDVTFFILNDAEKEIVLREGYIAHEIMPGDIKTSFIGFLQPLVPELHVHRICKDECFIGPPPPPLVNLIGYRK
jgi:hypothetical protein